MGRERISRGVQHRLCRGTLRRARDPARGSDPRDREAAPTGNGNGGVALKQIGDFDQPVYTATAPGKANRKLLFVVERGGAVRVIRNGKTLDKPFLDISSLLRVDFAERGLLSIAFDPDYAKNRRFYVYYTAAPDGDVDGRPVQAHEEQQGRRRPGLRPRGHLDPARHLSEPQRRPGHVRPRREHVARHRRRRRRLRSARERPEPRLAARQAAADHPEGERRLHGAEGQPVRERGGRGRDLRLRAPQPLPVLLRRGHEDDRDRRRRPGRLGGDRLPEDREGRRRQLRLGRLRGRAPARAAGRLPGRHQHPAPRPARPSRSSSTRTRAATRTSTRAVR